VQLKNYQIVVPIFFFTQDGALFTRCYKPVLKSNSDYSTVEIHIPVNFSKIIFDDETLQTLSVEEFSATYDEIKLNNGLKFSDCCGNIMIGEKLIDWLHQKKLCLPICFFPFFLNYINKSIR
jgi:hypothetical protein